MAPLPDTPTSKRFVMKDKPARKHREVPSLDSKSIGKSAESIPVTIAAVGDIGLVGAVREQIQKNGPSHPFALVAPILRNADIAFGNLEIPFTHFPPAFSRRKSHNFWASPSTASCLKEAGFKVLSFANNHTLEHGREGLETTLELLRALGIQTLGAGTCLRQARAPVIFDVRGVKIGFLAYAKSDSYAGPTRPGPAPLNFRLIKDDILTLRPHVHILVCSLHFGTIYMDYPHPEDIALCHRIADTGADVILGHHPHVVQGLERYGNTLIAYSLGEFLFDAKSGLWHSPLGRRRRQQSIILILHVSVHGLLGHEVIPTTINPYYQVDLVKTSKEVEAVISRINALSAAIPGLTHAFYHQYASTRLFRYELNAALHHLRALNFTYFFAKILRIRKRHLAILVSLLSRYFQQALHFLFRSRSSPPPAKDSFSDRDKAGPRYSRQRRI